MSTKVDAPKMGGSMGGSMRGRTKKARKPNAWAKAAGEYYNANKTKFESFSDVLQSEEFKEYYHNKGKKGKKGGNLQKGGDRDQIKTVGTDATTEGTVGTYTTEGTGETVEADAEVKQKPPTLGQIGRQKPIITKYEMLKKTGEKPDFSLNVEGGKNKKSKKAKKSAKKSRKSKKRFFGLM